MDDVKSTAIGIEYIFMHSMLTGIVVLGAVCNALVQYSNARKSDTKFDKIDVLIAVIISIFSGIIFGLTAAHFWPGKPIILHGVSGMGAFLGLNGLNKLTDTLLEVVSKHARK